MVFFDRSWNATNGAPDAIGGDDGRDKIDLFVRTSPETVLSSALAGLAADAASLTVIHIGDPDTAGHAEGFGSASYLDAVEQADAYLGQVMSLLETDVDLADALLVVTSDHGGTNFDHADPTVYEHFRIPFGVWGPGVAAGSDLYLLNDERANPGIQRPDYSGIQPIRNVDVANLVTLALGLGQVTGSTVGNDFPLVVVDRTTSGNSMPWGVN